MIETRHCPRCETNKPLSDFRTRKVKGKEYPSPYCNPCTAAYQAERRKARIDAGEVLKHSYSKEEATRYHWLRRLKKLGITEDEYEAMLELQGGTCAICPAEVSGTRGTVWPVDHDHKTGEPRGLLCHTCNQGLGLFKDDPALLARAIDYLASTPYSQATAAKLMAR